ncbi:DUF72 domain-containing protein [Cognatilysobacter bugurensis]|uniref:DUF72 domain-containing protein n=1 Tax=Cognatilysobacter bugurensis TaxID=543356 RepID=A0A918T3D9_9GAMM|nr:DUF72 domain-containing protein [Lysobacter bugurensis]GHA84106.1 hypothetical protein GCM10007067_22890 [Lysobacter bugurensis]
MEKIRIGTASWTDPSLIKSGLFYPKGVNSAEERLRFYAANFPVVEVDSSYYALPSSKNSDLWIERTPDDFTFNIKAFRLLTGHQTPASALPKDIAEELAPHFAEKRNIYYTDVPDSLRDELWKRYERGIRPLRAGGKLTAVHFQFAPWVTPSPDWKRHLEECVGRLGDYLLAFEFRNKAWYGSKEKDEETLAMERDLGVAHVTVDEPQTKKGHNIPQVWAVASPELVIVRLHGRNHETWDAKDAKAASERFNYDYTDKELKDLGKKIRKIAVEAPAQVIFNNNYGDQGQRNAKSLMKILGKHAEQREPPDDPTLL